MVDRRDASAVIEPAVQGTKWALAAARRASVEHVVVTPSMVAKNGHMTRGTFGPDDWTDLEVPGLNPYVRSKTLAERAVWDFARAHPDGPELVAVNPGAVYGPTLTGDAGGQSLKWVVAMLRGRVPLLARFRFTMVDVRDVALVHLRAMTAPEAAGKRYVVASRDAMPFVRIAEVLAANGYRKVATRTAPDFVVRAMGLVDRDVRGLVDFLGKNVDADPSATVRDLGWSPIPFEATVVDVAESLRPVVEA